MNGECIARAIACLPELVEAARQAVTDIESLHALIQVSAKLHPAADSLRRILARIDGEGA